MSNATRWYATREALKAAVGIKGASQDALVDRELESASEDIEETLGRRFIPYTATKYYSWPQRPGKYTYCLDLDEDLLAVTALTKEGDTATAIAASDYFIEPVNQGPPYTRIEIDRAATGEAFESDGNTHQRQIRVTGRWGFRESTKAAGALAEALDASETEVQVSDASLIGVGDTILVETEAMFVSGRAALTTGTTVNDASVTAAENDVSLTVANGAAIKLGEVILIDSEKMLVEDVVGNVLTVKRAYDGSVLAAHSTATTIYAYRSLTVVRGVNGTTAATHADTTAISKYVPPADITEFCLAVAAHHLAQGRSSWTGQIGGGAESVNVRSVDSSLFFLRKEIEKKYARVVFG